ncbi:MbnP family protein [Pelagicoccus mobilis]|uniref:C-type cytochrome n=1 Tax=Pelagicoccus mobilis TaxID=415221 RepID=A0A934S1D8_9BACT|nr:MbnP family protein [Pelagicoccus mobilis]MBK1880562.1 c-type cytochrome [Pelagicoccus mobilis]
MVKTLTTSLLLLFLNALTLAQENTPYPASPAPLHLSLTLRVDDTPLHLNSLRYTLPSTQHQTPSTQYSITRLSFLLSHLAFQTADGTWVEAHDKYAYFDAKKRILSFDTSIPPGDYQALRFNIGLPPEANHADPAQYPARHPLNPDHNQLHWTWSSGYIFLALEGRHYKTDKTLGGYVYHFANDPNLTPITINHPLTIQSSTQINLTLDLGKLLASRNPLSPNTDGPSTHSHPGDPIAAKLKSNLPTAFTLNAISQSQRPSTQYPIPNAEPNLPAKYSPYPFTTGKTFPIPDLPADNPLITERVELGEKLFFDTQLSSNRQISCASCHTPELAFSDPRPQSIGVSGKPTRRHSMALFNLAWKQDFFWDGRVTTLRQQILHPIQDPNEMGLPLETLLERLNSDPNYKADFAKAFHPADITPHTISLALESYLLTLTSHTSKFDAAAAGKAKLTDQERRGFELFMTEYEPRTGHYGADCFHCHGGALFTDNQFHNNGLLPTSDHGRYEVTGNPVDKNKFSTPSLRNVSKTAPYMHDGRFRTLEEVIQHYSTGIHRSDTIDPNLAKHPTDGLQLSVEDQAALIAFLKTL